MGSKQGHDDAYVRFIAGLHSVEHLALGEMHDQFRDLLEAFQECDDRDCPTTLMAVRTQLVRQAAAEDAWMRTSHDPGRERHKHEHDFWLEVVDEVQARLAQGDVQVARWLATELSQWFEAHARDCDGALVDHLGSRRDARCVLGERSYWPRRSPRIPKRGD